jgi:hypothetical protein
MNGAFILSGMLVLAGAAGTFWNVPHLSIRDCWLSSCLLGALPALGLIIDGAFTLESMLFHALGFLVGIGSTIPGFPIVGLMLRRNRDWRALGNAVLVAGPVTLGLLILYFLTFSPTIEGAKYGVSGLVERVLVLEIFASLAALGWTAFQRQRRYQRSVE